MEWSQAPGAHRYRVQWRSGEERYVIGRTAEVTGTSYTIPGLIPGRDYTVSVVSFPAGVCCGRPSGGVVGRPTYRVPDGAPSGVSAATATVPQQLIVSWTATPGAASYKVQWKSGNEWYSDSRQASTTSTSTTISGLIARRQYTFRVIAVPAGGGADLPSSESTGSPTIPPNYAASTTVRAWTTQPTGSRYPAETLQPSNPTNAASWRTTEYNENHALNQMNAAVGYAARTMGQPGGGGRTIAIIGETLDADHPTINPNKGHPDLQGSIIVNGRGRESSHETRAAGIAAARRNGVGMHGVAYNANIVGFSSRTGQWGDLGAILASVAGKPQEVHGEIADGSAAGSAHIANMSLITYRNTAGVREGMMIAAAAGRIMVGATGNNAMPNPEAPPGSYVTAPGIAGHAIVAGMLNREADAWNRPTSGPGGSSACGAAKRYCLFTPGQGASTTFGAINTATHGYVPVNGTSFAVPYVSGAAAVVWAAFPNKTGAQVVERLLSTAVQVDPVRGQYDSDGLSNIYGHGRLDLGAAMNPVGFTSSAVPGGGLVPVRRSFVELPPGFRLRPSQALRDSVVYDTQGFPFLHDLNPAFRPHRARRSSARAMEEFLASLGGEWTAARLGERTTVEFASAEKDPRRDARDEDHALGAYRLRTRLSPELSLTLGRGFGARGASVGFVSRRLARGLLHDGFAAGPYSALAGAGAELGAVLELDERTQLDFAGKDASGYFGGGRARLASLGATRRVGDALTLGARWGLLRERGSLLGVRGGGALGGFAGADTEFLDLSAQRRLGRMTLFGGLSRGWTRPGAARAGSLVSGWSGLRGDSFALGGEWAGLWRRADRLTLIASSPFRARGAGVHVDVPDREVADGVVAYTRRRVDLSPRGRELRLQLAYETEAAPDAALTVGGYLRLEPEHDPAAAPEFGAAAKLRARF